MTEAYGKFTFNIVRNCQTSFLVIVPFYIPTGSVWDFQVLEQMTQKL